MQDRIRRLYEMMLRVLTFMTTNTADFEAMPFVASTVAALREAANALETLGAAKFTTTAAAADTTLARGDAREDLQGELKYLAGLWRTGYEEVGGEPNKFRTPHGNGDRDWIAAGRAFVNELPAQQQFFIGRGQSTNFIPQLAAMIDAFEQTVDAAEAAVGDRVGTNAAFQEPARRGKKLVEKLAPAVKRRYRDQPQKLAAWLVASHIEKPSQTPPKGGTPVGGV